MAARFSISSKTPEKARIDHQAEIARLLDDSKTARADWATLSSEGPLDLTGLGWLTSDPATSSPADLMANASTGCISLLYARQMANALAVEARVASDPRPALASLDALITGLDHPG